MFNDSRMKNTIAPFVLRLALAAVFIYHGLGKVAGEKNTWGASWADHAWPAPAPPDVIARLDQRVKEQEELAAQKKKAGKEEEAKAAGEAEQQARRARDTVSEVYSLTRADPPPPLQHHAAQLAVAWGELLGGFALLFGILTRLAALGLIVIQVGAILTVTAAHGFSVLAGGYEYNVALIAMCFVLLLLGPGTFAVDAVWRFKRDTAPPQPATPPAAV